MSKKLNCIKCNKFLGEVEKGALSPHFNCICTKCLNIDVHKPKPNFANEKDALDQLKNIFGMK